MLVLVPTREDLLAIRSIEEAFDLSTTKIRKREVALIRVAYRSNLLVLSEHAVAEADDEMIPYESAKKVAGTGQATSKDVTEGTGRWRGLNIEGDIPDRRRIRTKVSWLNGYFVVTLHTVAPWYDLDMPVTAALITFEKSIGPGASVAIAAVPAEIRGDGEKTVRVFTFETAYRLEYLLRVARQRMAQGETEIRLKFDDDV